MGCQFKLVTIRWPKKLLTIEQDEKRENEQMKWNELKHLWN